MATITAEQVKKLRDQTGAGMMECKNALDRGQRRLRGGEHDPAQARPRQRGEEGRPRRPTKGSSATDCQPTTRTGMLVEVNCESDFVARTDDFQQLIKDVLAEIEKEGDCRRRGWLQDPDGPGEDARGRRHRQARREHGGAPLRALSRAGLRRPVHPSGRQDRRPGRVRRRDAGHQRPRRIRRRWSRKSRCRLRRPVPSYALARRRCRPICSTRKGPSTARRWRAPASRRMSSTRLSKASSEASSSRSC